MTSSRSPAGAQPARPSGPPHGPIPVFRDPHRVGGVRLGVVGLLSLAATGVGYAHLGPGSATGTVSDPALALAAAEPALASEPQDFVDGGTFQLVENTQSRITFEVDIDKRAIAAPEILDVAPLTSRQLLLTGKKAGRTSLIVWLSDNSIRRVDVVVQRDLSLLETALRDVHPSIVVSIAPDRDVVVLTGTVPYAIYSRRAEAVARAYIEEVDFSEDLLVGEAAEAVAEEQSRPDERSRATRGGKVINLIRIEGLPDEFQGISAEQKILEAILPLGGENVSVRRVVRGDAPDDAVDVLVLEGRVEDQVALTRVLSVAYKVFVGSVKGEDQIVTDGVAQTTTVYEADDLSISDDIKVIGDESGSLYQALQESGQGQNQQRGILGGFGQGGQGGAGSQSGITSVGLQNQVHRNIARARALELGDGRILSFIEVDDLPQVMVDIRIYEVNRTALLTWQTDNELILSDFTQPSLEPAVGAERIQGDNAARVGAQSNTDIQNVLGFFSGALSNQVQVSGSNYAIDSLITLLQSGNIVRSLASTTLSVLSGEFGIFEVGGQVPVDQSFASPVAGSTGVFNSVTFINFGTKLAVRPLVGEHDFITIDFVPEISSPDALLTAALTELTGVPPETFAFESRLLKTSSRLKDGYTLLVGGLAQKSRQDRSRQTPWLSKIPLLGALFQDFTYSDDDLQVVVLIRPSLVRDPLPDQALWRFPENDELLGKAMPARKPTPEEQEEAAEREAEAKEAAEEEAREAEEAAQENAAGEEVSQ